MDIDKIKKAEVAFRNSNELDSWLEYFSIHTWNKIGFARKRDGLKMHETTITQDFVFELWVALEQYKWSISVFEATSESTNGNDLEILVCTKKGYIILACQAKIIYKSDKYKAITHQVETKSKEIITQAELLIRYAKKEQGIPIYLFYNFCKDEEDLNQVKKQIGGTYEIENLGCSIAFATDIKKEYYDNRKKSAWEIPSFKDIHPKFAEPLNQFIMNLRNMNGQTVLCNKIPFPSTFKFYTFEEVNQDKNWSLISTGALQQTIDEKKAKKKDDAELNNDDMDATERNKLSTIKFKPKFRLVLNCKNS